jgi:hypothetical protein
MGVEVFGSRAPSNLSDQNMKPLFEVCLRAPAGEEEGGGERARQRQRNSENKTEHELTPNAYTQKPEHKSDLGGEERSCSEL